LSRIELSQCSSVLHRCKQDCTSEEQDSLGHSWSLETAGVGPIAVQHEEQVEGLDGEDNFQVQDLQGSGHPKEVVRRIWKARGVGQPLLKGLNASPYRHVHVLPRWECLRRYIDNTSRCSGENSIISKERSSSTAIHRAEETKQPDQGPVRSGRQPDLRQTAA
jgi:hypothetical protein